jgi:hypothetical protein
MNTTAIAIQYQSTVRDLPMPRGNGTFTVYDDGHLVSYPESSAIDLLHYMPNTETLVVIYKGSEKKYFYEAVPSYKIFQMLASESIGAFIAKAIKPHHEVWSPEPR